MTELEQLSEQAKSAIAQARELDTLEHLRVEYLGKKGRITALLKNLGQL